MKEIKKNVQAAQISKKTLNDAMNELIKEDAAATTISSILRGHKGRQTYSFEKNIYPQQAAKRQLQVSNTEPSTQLQLKPKTLYTKNVDTKKNILKKQYEKEKNKYPVINSDLQNKTRLNKAATKIGKVIKGHLSRKDTRNEIIKQASINKKIETALKKYNKIGEMMATRNETPMVLGESAPQRFIQSAARLRKKAFQSEISHVDTRVNLATKQEKEARIKTANEGISRMDNIIQKKSAAGRPRTRSEQEAAAGGGSSSRLSMLSTTSTLGSSTPTRTPKKK